jgi:hypothetical protein
MDEKTLLDVWNVKHRQLIASQLTPAFYIGLMSYLDVAFDLEKEKVLVKLLLIVSTALIGLIAIVNQSFVRHQSNAVVESMKDNNDKNPMVKALKKSNKTMVSAGRLINLIGFATWVIFTISLYK